MAFGLGVLKLSSAELWALSIPEIEQAYAGMFGQLEGAIDPTDFQNLMARFPD